MIFFLKNLITSLYYYREGPKPNHQGCQNQMNRNGIPI